MQGNCQIDGEMMFFKKGDKVKFRGENAEVSSILHDMVLLKKYVVVTFESDKSSMTILVHGPEFDQLQFRE